MTRELEKTSVKLKRFQEHNLHINKKEISIYGIRNGLLWIMYLLGDFKE